MSCAAQDTLPQEGHAEQLLSLKGQDLIGVPLQACNLPLLISNFTPAGSGVSAAAVADPVAAYFQTAQPQTCHSHCVSPCAAARSCTSNVSGHAQ